MLLFVGMETLWGNLTFWTYRIQTPQMIHLLMQVSLLQTESHGYQGTPASQPGLPAAFHIAQANFSVQSFSDAFYSWSKSSVSLNCWFQRMGNLPKPALIGRIIIVLYNWKDTGSPCLSCLWCQDPNPGSCVCWVCLFWPTSLPL